MKNKNYAVIVSALLGAACLSYADEKCGASCDHDHAKSQMRAALIAGFESEDVVSGKRGAQASLQPAAEVSYKDVTLGWFMNNPIERTADDRHEFSAAYSYDLCEKTTVSAGATYYLYPEADSNPNRTRELNFSVGYDTFLSPVVEFNYDIDLQQSEVVLGGSYLYDLDKIYAGLYWESAAAVGYVQANDENGDQASGSPNNGYAYAEVRTDLAYEIKEDLTMRVGPRLATNNDGSANNDGGHESHLWWGASLTAEF